MNDTKAKIYDATTLQELPGDVSNMLAVLGHGRVVLARWSELCEEWQFVDSDIANRESADERIVTVCDPTITIGNVLEWVCGLARDCESRSGDLERAQADLEQARAELAESGDEECSAAALERTRQDIRKRVQAAYERVVELGGEP